jgi:hypothetical protein
MPQAELYDKFNQQIAGTDSANAEYPEVAMNSTRSVSDVNFSQVTAHF